MKSVNSAASPSQLAMSDVDLDAQLRDRGCVEKSTEASKPLAERPVRSTNNITCIGPHVLDINMTAIKAPRVLLLGAGSIGGVYLYQLQRAGCHVTAVCRSNYNVVKQSGFKLTSVRFGNQQYRPEEVVADVAECSNNVYDFLVVCTKSLPESRPSLSDLLRPLITGRPDTAIVLAQNGIGIEDDIAESFPDNPILSGVVYCPAIQTAPGCIDYPEMLSLLELGTFPANAPDRHKAATNHFVDLMIEGGGGAEHHDNVQIARWSKLLMNAPWNPITALTLCTDGDFLLTSEPFALKLVWDCMLEVIALAEAVGIPGVNEEVARKKLSISTKRAETGTGREMSMMQDVRQGRAFEVEAIVGNAIRMGRENKVSMPRLDTIYALLKARLFSITSPAKSESSYKMRLNLTDDVG